MVNKPYTTKSKLEAFLNITIDVGDSDGAINQAVDVVDNFTNRSFIADIVASIRYFDGVRSNEMDIDECVSISKVEKGLDSWGDFKETILAGGVNGYYLLPNNYSARSLPISSIKLRGNQWVEGFQNNAITAKWGYSVNCPEAVTLATTIIGGGIYNYNRGGGGSVRSESIGQYSVTYTDTGGWEAYDRAMNILKGFKRYTL